MFLHRMIIVVLFVSSPAGAQADSPASLAALIDVLANPGQVLSEKSGTKTVVEDISRSYSPRVWWHRHDKYGPMDPIHFLRNSSLWFHNNFGKDTLIAAKGDIVPAELGVVNKGSYKSRKKVLFWPIGTTVLPAANETVARAYSIGFIFNGSGYFLKFEERPERTPATDISAPCFWRLGVLPGTNKVSILIADRAILLIEYWFHSAFSKSSGIAGDHQGDWEGVSALLEVGIDSLGKMSHKPLAFYYSAHGKGEWHCSKDLSWHDKHPEAFTALGTHAVYPHPGEVSSTFITDLTERGWSWDTWKNLKPISLEPYYGYSGAWGDVRTFSFTSGPLAPGPGFKAMTLNSKFDLNEVIEFSSKNCF